MILDMFFNCIESRPRSTRGTITFSSGTAPPPTSLPSPSTAVKMASTGEIDCRYCIRHKGYDLQTGFQERNLYHPKIEIFLKTSSHAEQLYQSDCLL